MQFDTTEAGNRRFLSRAVFAEQPGGLLREFEQADARGELVLISVLILVNQSQAFLLLSTPLPSLAIEEVGVDY